MYRLTVVLAVLLILAASTVSAQNAARRLDAPPPGTVLIEGTGGCGTWSRPWDIDYEAAIAWADVGVTSPLGGAIAQRFVFPDTVEICSVTLDFTQIGGHDKQSCDIYIWSGSSGTPSSVLYVRSLTPGPMATWPQIYEHVFRVNVCVIGEIWVGYWPNWPGANEGWYIAANVGEPSGASLTYVVAGVTDQSGWQPLSIAWHQIASVGIGVEYNPVSCAITPLEEGSWGRIKALYARQ